MVDLLRKCSFHIERSEIFHNFRKKIISHSPQVNISLERRKILCYNEDKKGGGYMETYKIAHYQKSGSMWFTNGGKLIITEREYIVKYLFQTVAKLAIDKTVASRLSANPINVGISLTDGINSIDLYFFKKTAEKLYDRFKI